MYVESLRYRLNKIKLEFDRIDGIEDESLAIEEAAKLVDSFSLIDALLLAGRLQSFSESGMQIFPDHVVHGICVVANILEMLGLDCDRKHSIADLENHNISIPSFASDIAKMTTAIVSYNKAMEIE